MRKEKNRKKNLTTCLDKEVRNDGGIGVYAKHTVSHFSPFVKKMMRFGEEA